MHGLVLAITVVLLALIAVLALVHLVRWILFPSEAELRLIELQDRDQQALRRALAVRAIEGDLKGEPSLDRRVG